MERTPVHNAAVGVGGHRVCSGQLHDRRDDRGQQAQALNVRELADIAWNRYQAWVARQAKLRGTQLELEDQDVPGQVNEWRGIWHRCELELIRLENQA